MSKSIAVTEEIVINKIYQVGVVEGLCLMLLQNKEWQCCRAY
jgi:hypothetical protein